MKIGIIQQHNTADIADNKSRLAVKIADLAEGGCGTHRIAGTA